VRDNQATTATRRDDVMMLVTTILVTGIFASSAAAQATFIGVDDDPVLGDAEGEIVE
jgi:hypothetical protein